MSEYISIPGTKSGCNIKLNRMMKEIWILDIRHILLKYEQLSARIRKIGEEIGLSDIRPIRIKYDKLGASIRKMVDDLIPRNKVNTD